MRLGHLSEKVATFISRALEAYLSFDSGLLLSKLASSWLGIARLSILSCVRPGKFVLPILYEFDSK